MATNQISSELVNIVSTTDISVFSLIGQAGFIVKLVMLSLVIASAWSWAIVFDKFILFKRLNVKTEKFERLFWSGQLLEQLYERVKTKADHPMAAVFVAAMYEWSRQKSSETSGSVSYLSAGIKERIAQAMNVAKSREMDKIENNINILATVGSVSPFIGLFGTVWGIMSSFQSIASAKSASLAVVAPGIAEALLATAIGLVAAIPAVIFYNSYANKINNFHNRIEDFSSELGALLSRELDEGGK
jgi:biopolymer transport protein TolQ